MNSKFSIRAGKFKDFGSYYLKNTILILRLSQFVLNFNFYSLKEGNIYSVSNDYDFRAIFLEIVFSFRVVNPFATCWASLPPGNTRNL